MKKYLMTGITALAMCFGFTSCSHDIEPASQEDLNNLEAEQIVNAYNQAFIKTFGQPAANQTWGFGTSVTRSFTRANEGKVIKPDMTDFPGYSTERCNGANRSPEGYADIVAPVTSKEAEWVQNWFSENPGLTPEGQPFKNFFVQHVSNNGHTKAGYFHSTEGGKAETVEAKTYNGIYMDKLQIGATASEADTDHTLDFNATNGFNDWNLIYYENSSALQFGYHESYGDSYEWYFKCVELEVPGSCFDDGKPRKGWYVGLSYYCNKQETSEKWHVIGGDRLQYGDDWILKIVPNDPIIEENYDVRIIAEDLNATAQDGDLENSDWDFNDVVFDVKFTSDNDAEITLIAAGGTLPLIVGVENPTDNTDYPANEVHNLFGVPVNYMVNTNAEAKHLNGGAPAVGHEAPKLSFSKSGVKASNGNLIPIHVQKTLKDGTKKWFELTAKQGQPAAKLAVNSKSKNFTICDEREDITKKYTNFLSWVVNNDPLIWW